MEQRLIRAFEWLHMHPELAFEERETASFLKKALEEAGIELLDAGTETGLIARIRGNGPGRIVGLRCDIDALPVREETGLPYASVCEGRMHACGHDFHAAVMLGAALMLKETADQWPGEVRIVFQPAEETAAGAQRIVSGGRLDDADVFLGVHSYPGFPAGKLGIREGAVMAAVDRFAIDIRGRGTHAAQPHKGIDPVVVQAAMVQSLQTIVSRTMDPFSHSLISITHVESGNTWNVIPETAFLEGTVRTLDAEDRRRIEESMRTMVASVAAAYGAQAELAWMPGPPAVVNDAALCLRAEKLAVEMGFEVGRQEDTMTGEDFSLYLEGRPGIFVRVGTGGEYPIHHPKFTVDPAAIYPAAKYFAELARREAALAG